ncbi:MAG: type 1 glutamine amidotransferase [Eubacteriales bacterium]|nr:type 1 glutamine amidotransferase [Eubacteriales bacterium]
MTITKLYDNDPFPSQNAFDWLVILGGGMNIYEEDKYPWLKDEKIFIKESIEAGKVVIGLCLGGQLIADVIGGKVRKNDFKEIGWLPVHFCDSMKEIDLFSFSPSEPIMLQWHEDTFYDLPKGAICIAKSKACEHQAFIYGDRVFGFQFHLENTADIIHQMVERSRDILTADAYIQSPEEILGHPEYIEQVREWIHKFLSNLEVLEMKGSLLKGNVKMFIN